MNFMKLTLKEMIKKERLSLKQFLYEALDNPNKFHIRINVPPGVGKSHAMLEYIRDRPYKKFIIIVLDHNMVYGKDSMGEFLDNNIGNQNWIHIKGKKQTTNVYEYDLFNETEIIRKVKLCNKDDGEEYFPGCLDCPLSVTKSCRYFQQFYEMYRKRIIVTTIESIGRLPHDRIIFFDESFDTKILQKPSRPLNTEMQTFFKFDDEEHIKLGSSNYTFYNSVKLNDKFEVNSEQTYFIKAFMEYTDMIQARTTEKKGEVLLFGRLRVNLPEYRKMVFNCATTPNELMINITDTEFLKYSSDRWYYYNCNYFSSTLLRNHILRFNRNWTKHYSIEKIPYVFGFFSKIFTNHNVLIITKKTFLSPQLQHGEELVYRKHGKFIDDFLPNADYAWFGLRGTNVYNKDYDMVIVYGRYGLTPIDNKCLEKINVNQKLIKLMDNSSMLQAIHRFRPLLRQNVPMIIMSDKDMSFKTESVPFERWTDYEKHYDMDYKQYKSMRELNKALGYKHGYVKVAENYTTIRKFMDRFFFSS